MAGDAAFLVPNKGLLVRDPITKEPLPAGGAMRDLVGYAGTYWLRRLRDGCVTRGKPPSATKTITRQTKVERRDN